MLQEAVPAPEALTSAPEPSPDPRLSELIDRYRDLDDYDAAEAVFQRLEEQGHLRLLVGPLAHAIYNRRRAATRADEHALEDAANERPARLNRRRRRTANTDVVVGERLYSTFHALLAREFFTGERWVTYADASPEDYIASMAYLRVKVAGITHTINFRQMCVDAIRAHPGALTLSDVPAEVVADVMARQED